MPPKRPTILQIIPALDTGGAELSTVEITDAIVQAGGRALVATTGGRLTERIVASGGEIIPFPAATKNPVRMLANVATLKAIIEHEDVDLVHARSRAPAWCALRAARLTAKPFITTYHGAYKETDPFKRFYNSVMARGDVVIANSAYTASLIKSRYGTPDAKICIIHRGVDPAAFDPAILPPERLDALRTRLGIALSQPVIVQAARLTRWKGQGVLIDALARLDAEPNWIAVLAGDDQGRTGYTAELKTEIAKAGLEGRVRLSGHIDDMPALLALATVAVVASVEPEAFGRTAIEAQMMGAPVIATRIGAPPETVLAAPNSPEAARTGWLVPPSHPAALAAALSEALSLSPAARSAFAARARAHAAARFSLDAMKRATLEIYDGRLKTTLAQAFTAAKMSLTARA